MSLPDLLDNEPIHLDNVTNFGSFIEVPQIFINATDGGQDFMVSNIRAIQRELLEKIMNVMIHIPAANYTALVEIWQKLIDIVATLDTRTEEMQEILEFLAMITQNAKDLEMEDDYVDSMNVGLSFDVIRNYQNDPNTDLLINYEPTVWNGAQLYSQLNPQQQIQARAETNDTEMNRFLYCMKYFERVLAYEPGYVFNRTIRQTNLALSYLTIVICSRPVIGKCDNSLKANYLGYMIDTLVRGRVLQAWLSQPSSKALINDIIYNYDRNHIMVKLCQLSTPKERATFMIRQLKRVPMLQPLVDVLSYQLYEDLLKTCARQINGKVYYVFDTNFIKNMMQLECFAVFIKMFSDEKFANAFTEKFSNGELLTTETNDIGDFPDVHQATNHAEMPMED
ncbi:GbNV_gp36-like [Fopius arisanus]|nr:GbNV_gp36-like [Fopius arisanus]